MNNEPVAWAVWEGRPHDLFFTKEEADELCRLKGGDAKTIPLYTYPVKELTDEEIGDFTHRMVLCCGVNPNSADINVLGLKFIVEEILRKAQEK